MKKIILLLALIMSCEKMALDGLYNFMVYRCENEEVICYSSGYYGGFSCKFKEYK